MAKRENAFVEAMKFLKKRNDELVQEQELKAQKKAKEVDDFYKKYYSIKENRILAERERANLLENCKNNNLSTAIKAIYITALEANTLTDEAIILAESLVDNWIKESGGASKIMRECNDKTYLLARICEIVESASINDLNSILEIDKEIEDNKISDSEVDEKDKDDSEEEYKEEKEEDIKKVKDAIDVVKDYVDSAEEKLDNENSEDKDKSDDKKVEEDETLDIVEDDDEAPEEPAGSEKKDSEDEKDESKDEEESDNESEDKSDEDEEDSDEEDESEDEDAEDNDATEVVIDDDETLDIVDDENDESEDDIESADPEDTDNDGIEDEIEDDLETDDVIEEPENYDNEVLKDLDKEDDVKKAVAVIRQRVADAEETFIKNNAKDKEQINDLLNKISNNVKTVEELDKKNDSKDTTVETEESVRMVKRKISEMTNNRPLTIYEKVARYTNRNILRNSDQLDNYINESGSLDMNSVMETSKVIYSFLETLNTIQIVKIDENYIKEFLENM